MDKNKKYLFSKLKYHLAAVHPGFLFQLMYFHFK